MKKYKQITREQRYEISGYLKAGFNKFQIAKLLGFYPDISEGLVFALHYWLFPEKQIYQDS